MRRAARIDANQREIVATLRSVGALVILLSAIGKGVPDLLVGFRGVWTLLEVKDGKKKPSARVFTPAQVKLRQCMEANQLPVATVLDAAGALRAIGVDVAGGV